MNDATTETETRTAQLVMLDQQLALSAYLNALLRPAPVETVTDVAPAVVAEPEFLSTEQLEAPVIEEVTAIVSQVAEPAVETHAEPAPVSAGLPDWAQGEFQCLLFRVAGLTLALPLAKLNGVLPWDAGIVTPMPNHRPWFLGLREHLGHQVKLIDVAKVVLPPERAAAEYDLGKVILIDDGRWGLAVSEVAEVITLSAEAVKWRKRETAAGDSRAWLAGTVIERMCALIDSEAFAGMLGGNGPPA